MKVTGNAFILAIVTVSVILIGNFASDGAIFASIIDPISQSFENEATISESTPQETTCDHPLTYCERMICGFYQTCGLQVFDVEMAFSVKSAIDRCERDVFSAKGAACCFKKKYNAEQNNCNEVSECYQSHCNECLYEWP